jgi:hypothetical protein
MWTGKEGDFRRVEPDFRRPVQHWNARYNNGFYAPAPELPWLSV